VSERKKIIVSAGELSGDEHAAKVISALRALDPAIECRGMGGRNLRAAGVITDVDSETAASVMGFGELFGSLGRVLGALRTMQRLIRSERPDLLITVDFAEFNMHLAAAARAAGVPVLNYISPQVWAWRRYRVKAIARSINQAAVIFPFERDFFSANGYPNAVYVGHPFADEWRETPPDRAKLLGEIGLDPARPTVVVLPGSRRAEVERHLTIMRSALDLVRRDYPTVQAVIAVAPTIDRAAVTAVSGERPWLRVTQGNAIDMMRIGDAGLLKSGTSNLQGAFCGLPFAMFYRTSPLSAFIVRRWVDLTEYSIVNVLRPGTVPELVQDDATPEATAHTLKLLLFDEVYRANIKAGLADVCAALRSYDERPEFVGTKNAPERVARLAKALLDPSN
jgi:lipid-A-disaccharide synthase